MVKSLTMLTLPEAEKLRLLMPLHFFYAQDQRALPPVQFVAPSALPENERGLLVHDHDMTSGLREYHQSPIDLHVERREESPEYLMRLVVLMRREKPVPVEFGAIGIQLESLSTELRKQVLEGRRPLGALLEEFAIHYHSEPAAFFTLKADSFIAELLQEKVGSVLWGRCNALTFCDGVVFADIVEILPRALAAVPPTVHRNSAQTLSGHCARLVGSS